MHVRTIKYLDWQTCYPAKRPTHTQSHPGVRADYIHAYTLSVYHFCTAVHMIHHYCTHLVGMCTNHKDWSLWTVAADGIKPELKPGVFVAESSVPHQQVDGTVRQEELQDSVKII